MQKHFTKLIDLLFDSANGVCVIANAVCDYSLYKENKRVGLSNSKNRIRCLNIQSDGLACESLDKDLHASAETQDKVKGGLFLDVIV